MVSFLFGYSGLRFLEMFSVSRLAQFISAVVSFTSFVGAIDTITISGRHFVNSKTGEKVTYSSEHGADILVLG